MDTDQVANLLDDPAKGRDWLSRMGVTDRDRGHSNLLALAESGITLDLMASLVGQLERYLPNTPDPDQALNNLERFISAQRSPLAFAALIERDESALPVLLQMITTSQHLSDLLVRDPEGFDLLRLTEGQPLARQTLVDEICAEVASVEDDAMVMTALRRFKQRETLRIAYGDIVSGQRVGRVTRQISYLAEAICEAALRHAMSRWIAKYGTPRTRDGSPATMAILALGKLGGSELNYSSDIDLIPLYSNDGNTDGERSRSNQEFFERVSRDFVKLLTEPTELGIVYRVDLRLRPNGKQGPIISTLENMLRYYDMSGRTWERQAYVKARAIAGDLDLGNRLLAELEPWIYRRYLSRADITEIKALKRRIEHRAQREGVDARDVKTGSGGIRDIEFVIQFLQLLNGGDLPGLRTTNTLEAIDRLAEQNCLNMQERGILQENYAFLRKVEHRLQIMYDLQTHTLPDDEEELRKFAIRMGYDPATGTPALDQFRAELQERGELNRKILNHLLHDAFASDEDTEPEIDLVLHPEPTRDEIHAVLGKHGFRDVDRAYVNLNALSIEPIPFLSTRRCRHFLAAIAPRLLTAISKTPDPDATLVSLSQVSDSLGGKGVLWELFSFNPPSLNLYVNLCASSPYLTGILTSNPGMIDELMDSLVLDRLPTLDGLSEMLNDLCRAAEDTEPILHSFKNSQHLRVGVRDILGKEDVRETHQALSDIAEVCLTQITRQEFAALEEKHGTPQLADGQPCELIIVAMGKLGGREPNYHSDLDVVFLYEGAGQTKPTRAGRETSNQHFFSQLAARIIKRVTQIGPNGRLYELDPRLRPTGKSGALAVSLDEFHKYFVGGTGQTWERQALCKARVTYGSPQARTKVMQAVRDAILSRPWSAEVAEEVRQMRMRLQDSASPQNLKRGIGGTVDVEFLVQMLQLRHAAEHPEVLVPGTLDAAERLFQAGLMSADDHDALNKSYRFLRSVEARLRLMNTTARHDFPEEESEQRKLAFLLGYPSHEQLAKDVAEVRTANRQRFERLVNDCAMMDAV